VAAVSSLVPEFLVSNIKASLAFWVELLDFKIHYDRPEEGFAYLKRDGLDVMLKELGRGRQWITGEIDKPLGRGINFQMKASDWSEQLVKLRMKNWPLFMEPEIKWYRVDDVEVGQQQFLVQDPDGYLLRLAQPVGERKVQ
jgi:catechol 2,3-dioxygenase-like lactoylglutathione lyase family enzyme